MQQSPVSGRPPSPSWPLYDKLMAVFPDYRTKRGFFDVKRFRSEPVIAKSHEAIYKWFRANKLSPTNANAIVALANSADNAASMALHGIKPPTIDDFKQFVF